MASEELGFLLERFPVHSMKKFREILEVRALAHVANMNKLQVNNCTVYK